MTGRIFRSIFLVAAIILTVGLVFTMAILYQYFGSQLQRELQNETKYLSLAVEQAGTDALNGLTAEDERVTLVDTDGRVLYDNHADEAQMENHADREEIKEAMELGSGTATRQSDTLGEKTVYYATRLSDGRVLRVSSTQYTVAALLGGMIQPLLILLVVMFILSAVMASRASKRIVEPLNQLDLEHPAQNVTYDELAPLLGKINYQRRTIREQLQDAKRQQEEFAIITDNMSEGLLVIDRQTELLSSNSSALRMLGAEEVPARESVLTLNRSEPFRVAVEEVLKGKHQTVNMEMGDRRCRLIANPVFRDGELAGAVLLMMDVTEKQQLEDMRREFTANVSHEMKTPLTSISGFAEIMRDGLVQPSDIKNFAGHIFDETQRLINLVGDIIKISQLDEGCLPYEWEPVDLYGMVSGIFQRLESAAEKAKVSLHLEGEHITRRSVRPILDEVIYNLCDNAVKYNRPGGKVTVRIAQQEGKTLLTVEDTGIGIAADHQPRVFERFYRVDKSHSREIGGTGLGLSIVKHGAAYLGIDISLHSVPGEGSAFTLCWEAEEEKPAE